MLTLGEIQGTMKLGRLAKSLAVDVNSKRRSKGLLPRPVRFFDTSHLLDAFMLSSFSFL